MSEQRVRTRFLVRGIEACRELLSFGSGKGDALDFIPPLFFMTAVSVDINAYLAHPEDPKAQPILGSFFLMFLIRRDAPDHPPALAAPAG